MVYVFNLQNIHSLSNVVILFRIKTCQPCHYIKPMTHVYTRERHENKNTRVSGLPMLCFDRRPLQKCRSVRILRSSFEAQTCTDNDVKNICLGNLFLGYG